MIRSLSPLLLATAATLASVGSPAPPPAPAPPAATSTTSVPAAPAPLAERLGWNARERTGTGIRELAAGHADAAASSLDTALRLTPSDPRAEFNAGTGHLAAGRPDAVPLLERAAAGATPGLASDAWYNLGNARLAGHDAHGAVDAYVRALRRDPGRQDAKHNLELALRELEQQKKQQEQRAQASAGQQNRDRERKRSAGDETDRAPSGSPKPSPSGEEGKEPSSPRNQGTQSPTSRGESNQPSGASPQQATGATATQPRPGSGLPGFRDQPDLDAKQAAALLRAVENLERQQRRQRALERARARGDQGIDW